MAQEIESLADRLATLMQRGLVEEAMSLIASIHPADQADVFTNLEPDLRPTFFALLSAEGQAELIEYLDEDDRRELVKEIPRDSLARVLDKTANDVAADVLRELPPAEAARLLSTMASAADITPLLDHADETAGGLMTRSFVPLHEEMTVQEAINYLRLRRPWAEEAYYLYVLDNLNRLEGVVNLRSLITAPPETRIAEIMSPDVIAIAAGADQEETARLIQRYRLRALPVVDEERHLLGVTTVDDLMEVAEEEATEDMYRMAGVGVKEYAFSPLHESARRRIPWLAFNMAWAFAAASVVNIFEGTIEQVAALAIFMPVIAGQGGNAGIQTATIVVRSMALGEIVLADVIRLLLKEWSLGIIKGVLFGLVLGTVAWLWKGNATLGMIAGLAMFLNMLVASTTGVLVPMTLRKFGLDPATIAGVFDTMVTDLMGFLIFLGLATLLISQLT